MPIVAKTDLRAIKLILHFYSSIDKQVVYLKA